jgi:hypothetical protein
VRDPRASPSSALGKRGFKAFKEPLGGISGYLTSNRLSGESRLRKQAMWQVRAVVVTSMLVPMTPLDGKGADLVVWWEEGYYTQEDEAVREPAWQRQLAGPHCPARDDVGSGLQP